MTLVLSCITDKFAIQAADRRVRWLYGPQAGELADDNRNKIVLACNRMAFAYSGLAETDGQNTDDWIAEIIGRLPEYRASLVLKRLSDEATKRMRMLSIDAVKKRHAFVAVGWATFVGTEGFEPFIVSISNSLDDAWNWLPAANDSFHERLLRLLAGAPLAWTATGATLEREEAERVERDLRACVERDTGSAAYIRVLTEAIRRTARRDDNVGRAVLAICIPRGALASDETMVLQGTTVAETHVISMYYPQEKDEGVQYGPHAACPGVIVTGTQSGALTPAPRAPTSTELERIAQRERGPIILADQIGDGKSRSGAFRPFFARAVGQPRGPWGPIGYTVLTPSRANQQTGRLRPTVVRLDAGCAPELLQTLLTDDRQFLLLENPEHAGDPVTEEWLAALSAWLGGRGVGTRLYVPSASLTRGKVVNDLVRGLRTLAAASELTPRRAKGEMFGGFGFGTSRPIEDEF